MILNLQKNIPFFKIVEYNKSEEIDVQVEGSRHDSEAKLEVGLGEMEI